MSDHSRRGGHPGAYGVDMERDRMAQTTISFSELDMLHFLIACADPRVQPLPERAGPTPSLDEIVERDAALRDAALERYGLTSIANDYDALVARLAEHLRMTLEDARGMITEYVDDYLAYRDAAVSQWAKIAALGPFNAARIARLARDQYDIVAVANGLRLTMAEALAHVRDLFAGPPLRPLLSDEGEGG